MHSRYGFADKSRSASRQAARVGLVGAWWDPEDPNTWSGTPLGMIQGLDHLGVYAGYLDATPWQPLVMAVRRWIELTGRSGPTWTHCVEMRALSALSASVRRLATPRHRDGWIQFVGGYGRPVRGRVVTVCDMTLEQLRAMPSSFFGPFGTHGLSPRALRALHRQQLAIYRGAYGCCVLGGWAKDSLVQDYGLQPEKVHVIGCGRNLDVPVSPDRQWAVPRFLFVGRNWERKNGDAMVRAFVRLHDQVPEARLDVVGDHPRLSVEGVTGHGELSTQNRSERVHLELLFGQATCFVMPSLVEPFGIAYVEAAAAGLPSIATTVGGARDAVASGGILVDPHDDGAIFAAMRRLAKPAEARRLGAAAMKRSALFTWPIVAERLFRALDLPGSPGRELADFL